MNLAAIHSAAAQPTFIETARRRIEGTTTDALSAKLDQIGARLEAIEKGTREHPPTPA